jgi:hypothetical protein
MINKNYFVDQIEVFDEDSLVIYSSDAYDLNRPEAQELFKNEPFPFTQEMYNYPYNAAKGKIFNRILDTDCSFEDFVLRHASYKPGYKFMWMIDEFYFSDCVNHKNHGVTVHKLKRGYTSNWIADKRIERHNFPVELELEAERNAQVIYGLYDEEKLKQGYYIDVNCCRPYSKYKQAIDNVINTVLGHKNITHVKIDERTDLCSIMDKHKSDKASKPDWVDFAGHNYTRYYSTLFEPVRYEKINVFELGIGTNDTSYPCNMGELGSPGASLKGWKEYFPNAQIFGADIDTKILFYEDRIKTFFCDQTIPKKIKNMWEEINEKFDIIIDDGFHQFDANITFLENSIRKLKMNGYFIVEDVKYSELYLWQKEIPKLENKYSEFSFEIISLEWTHSGDNNLIVIKRIAEDAPNASISKKVALISTFCDTEEKQKVLLNTITKIKELGIDVMALGPNFIQIPDEIIRKCDYFFYTKDNPILKWPIRMYTHWYEMPFSENRVTTLKRGLPDYNWAALYQTKKLSQIALSFDYDIFYHMIYDVEIDEVVCQELLSNEVNIIHPRRDPHHPDVLWESTLHFMVFDRPTMKLIEKEIELETFLETNGMAEGEVLKWKNKFGLKTSDHPVTDLIFYWGDYDFFDYRIYDDFKTFISKNERHNIWLGENPPYETELTSNLRMSFHSFKNDLIKNNGINITINGTTFTVHPNQWEILEFPICSQKVESIYFEYEGNKVDFTEQYQNIMFNQIYYNHRP